MSFFNELQEINQKGTRFPFAAKLKEQYNLDVPAGAPKYQLEYLYKYIRQAEVEGKVSANQLIAYAAKKTNELFTRYPWLVKKYEDVVIKKVEKTTISRPEKADCPDGTIVFCEKRGKYVMYMGGHIVVRARTVDKVKEIAQKKLNFIVA
jgi:hypothetical protein